MKVVVYKVERRGAAWCAVEAHEGETVAAVLDSIVSGTGSPRACNIAIDDIKKMHAHQSAIVFDHCETAPSRVYQVVSTRKLPKKLAGNAYKEVGRFSPAAKWADELTAQEIAFIEATDTTPDN
jgi:hypothetical protein